MYDLMAFTGSDLRNSEVLLSRMAALALSYVLLEIQQTHLTGSSWVVDFVYFIRFVIPPRFEAQNLNCMLQMSNIDIIDLIVKTAVSDSLSVFLKILYFGEMFSKKLKGTHYFYRKVKLMKFKKSTL